MSEAPRGKPRGILLLRNKASGCEGWIFAEPCEAKDTILPCGKPQGILAKKGEALPLRLPVAKQKQGAYNARHE
ncbi:MAG: hypothetical protein PHP98_10355 [Kiritimatiellae bacterium]|nr:hypothetical protein [Kiritimatiellia bacterium]